MRCLAMSHDSSLRAQRRALDQGPRHSNPTRNPGKALHQKLLSLSRKMSYSDTQLVMGYDGHDTIDTKLGRFDERRHAIG
jgi:hypothetical protein